MARTRSIKPAFFTNEILGALPYQDRLLFIGLWTIADREGRLEDRPQRIRAEIFPYDHEIDIEASLLRLVQQRFINRYITVNPPLKCIEVSNFKKHQSPHVTEKKSMLPMPVDLPLDNVYATLNISPSTLITGLPSTLPPGAASMTPALDEQFQDFKTLYESVGNPIDEDFANGSFCWRAWCLLDFEQRCLVVASLRERQAAGVGVLHKPDNYLTKNEWKRKIRANGTGRQTRDEQIAQALREA